MAALLKNDPDRLKRWQNLCAGILSLEIENLRYENTLHAAETISIDAMTTLAVGLSSVRTELQLESVLRYKLSGLQIPGIVLSLCPGLSESISATEIRISIPRNEDSSVKLPFHVREPAFFPKGLMTQPFQAKLELLFHNGVYIGYALISLGNKNLAVYESVSELLSQTLYNLFVHHGRVQGKSLIIKDREILAHTAGFSYDRSQKIPENSISKSERLTEQSIMDYLIDHLDEMTNLSTIASHFNLSEGYLSRRVKELTGYSVQTIHERLKIEQAKNLIKSGSLKINDIASRLGFSNSNYFSNVFKKVTGLSPLNWAKQQR